VSIDRRRTGLVAASLVAPVVAIRLVLHSNPDLDLDVAGTNVHHLFTGLVLVVAGGLPLAALRGAGRVMDACAVAFGVGLGLALDEWLYLVVTDGSNGAYLLPISLWGAVAGLGLALAWLAGVHVAAARTGRRRIDGGTEAVPPVSQ